MVSSSDLSHKNPFVFSDSLSPLNCIVYEPFTCDQKTCEFVPNKSFGPTMFSGD